MLARKVDQPLPRSVNQMGCGKDQLKPTGLCQLASCCNAICPFRGPTRLSENGRQPFRVRIVLTYDQDSSQIRDSQRHASMGFGLFSHFASLFHKDLSPRPSDVTNPSV